MSRPFKVIIAIFPEGKKLIAMIGKQIIDMTCQFRIRERRFFIIFIDDLARFRK